MFVSFDVEHGPHDAQKEHRAEVDDAEREEQLLVVRPAAQNSIARARLFVWSQRYHSLSLGYCTPESARSRLRSAR